MAKRRYQKAFVVVTPHPDHISHENDGFNFEIEITPQDVLGTNRVTLLVWANPSRFSDGERVWFHHLFWKFAGGWADVSDMKRAMKELQAIHKYIDGLPVRPQNPHQFVRTIIQKYNPEEITVMYFKSEHAPACFQERTYHLARLEHIIADIINNKIPANANA